MILETVYDSSLYSSRPRRTVLGCLVSSLWQDISPPILFVGYDNTHLLIHVSFHSSVGTRLVSLPTPVPVILQDVSLSYRNIFFVWNFTRNFTRSIKRFTFLPHLDKVRHPFRTYFGINPCFDIVFRHYSWDIDLVSYHLYLLILHPLSLQPFPNRWPLVGTILFFRV